MPYIAQMSLKLPHPPPSPPLSSLKKKLSDAAAAGSAACFPLFLPASVPQFPFQAEKPFRCASLPGRLDKDQ